VAAGIAEMPDDLALVVDPERVCQRGVRDVDGGERSARQKETMFARAIIDLADDVPFVVQPIRFSIRGSWDNVDGRKLTLQEPEAVSSGRVAEQSHDLPLIIDAVRDRRPRIGYIEVLKKGRGFAVLVADRPSVISTEIMTTVNVYPAGRRSLA